MLKSIKLVILGLFAASATFTTIPEANALIKTTENETVFNEDNNLPLIARHYRRRRRVRVIRRRRYPKYRYIRGRRYRYRRLRKVRTRSYRKCVYRVRYYRGIRRPYRVCRYYRR